VLHAHTETKSHIEVNSDVQISIDQPEGNGSTEPKSFYVYVQLADDQCYLPHHVVCDRAGDINIQDESILVNKASTHYLESHTRFHSDTPSSTSSTSEMATSSKSEMSD